LEGWRILIVERNAGIREVLGNLLTGWKMQPVAFSTASEVLAAPGGQQRYDAAILDPSMPGQEALAGLHHEPAPLPVIRLSPLGARRISSSKTGSQVAGEVSKPVKPAALLDALLALARGLPREVAKLSLPGQLNASLAERLPLRLLLAEDNVINQKVALRLFQQMGYQVIVATNGLEAVAAAQAAPYDLVFMDMQMPEMDGLEAVAEIRRLEAIGSLPVDGPGRDRLVIVAMTANAMAGDRDRCLEGGMDDYIAKPVRGESLRALIEKWGTHIHNQRREFPDTALLAVE
jgi:CheY-like chemotaxis protein